jgi:hypothetical protein
MVARIFVMRSYKTTILLVLFTFIVAVTVAATKITNISQGTASNERQQQNDNNTRRLERRNRYPAVDYDASEPIEPEKRAARRAKNSFYDKSGFAVKDPSPRVDEESLENEWSLYVPALPVTQSNIIIIGEILGSEAHISNDKSGVYSEFTVRIDELLKGAKLVLNTGETLFADRTGGIVQYSNGHKRLYSISGQNMPRIGGKYVLFLTISNQDQNYHILTGYELLNGKVSPLDESTRMNVYEGMDETSFLQALREAITQASQVVPDK